MKYIAIGTRLAVAAIFLAAAPEKIINPGEFALSVAGYHILPDALRNLVAITLPWVELVLGATLLCSVWVRPALLLANLLFVVFLAAVALAALRGLNIDCGCFGSSSAPGNMRWYIIRDLLFIALGLSAFWLHSHHDKPLESEKSGAENTTSPRRSLA